MKLNKQILEAIQRGINLAIDDLDDMQDIETQKTGQIDNDLYKTHDYFELQTLSNKLLTDIGTLTISDIKNISKLCKKFDTKIKIRTKQKLKNIILYICSHLKFYNPDLNWMDISDITDLTAVFRSIPFSGDISEWDVSNVTNMEYMFNSCKLFNCDISRWDVSNVTDVRYMFAYAEKFNQNISNWNFEKIVGFYKGGMFLNCPIKKEYMPKGIRPEIVNRDVLSEAIHRGINLAIDDFDDAQDINIQKRGEIENKFKTKEYLDFKKLSNKITNVINDASLEDITEDDIISISELSKKLGVKHKVTNKTLVLLIQYILEHLEFLDADLNWIDTSEVTDMTQLFARYAFSCDISEWDVSNVKIMSQMFHRTDFNGDISNWDVHNVEDMSHMFEGSTFNGNISRWDVSSVKRMNDMFANSVFNQNISDWDVHDVRDMYGMFFRSRFNQNISNWNVGRVSTMRYMFAHSLFNQDISKWNVSNVRQHGIMFSECPIKEEYKPKFDYDDD